VATGASPTVDAFLTRLQAWEVLDTQGFSTLHLSGGLDLGDGPGPTQPVLGRLGRGAMGDVHLVWEPALRRKVAVKRAHEDISAQAALAGRFRAEAQITAQLDHPNIVPVYRMTGDAQAYTMKVVSGVTLKAFLTEAQQRELRGDTLPEEQALPARLERYLKVCDAVAYAHSRGVIHRDLKPANIMLGRFNAVYVMDWGLATLTGGADDDLAALETRVSGDGDAVAEESQWGVIVGTPAYMSPEQAAGQRVDARSDQYALGLLLHEVVSLQRAIKRGTPREALYNATLGHTEPLAHIAGEPIAPELAAIISAATQTDPERRYPSVSALAADVRRHLRGESVAARPDRPLRGLLRWMARNTRATLVALLVVVIFASALTVGMQLRLRTQERTALAREAHLAEVLTRTSRQAHRLDSWLLRYTALLEGLAGTAEHALGAAPPDTPYYLDPDYAAPETAPPDYRRSAARGEPVSFGWPVLVLAPGVRERDVRPALRRLGGLRHAFRDLLLRSHSEASAVLPEDAATALLDEAGVPIVGTYVALAEGIHASFPGHTGYPADYDPRRRSWYLDTVDTFGPRWATPHLDINGQGLIVTCSMALYDTTHRFRGVAALELTFDHIVSEMADTRWLPPGAASVELLDKDGRVVLSSQRPLPEVTDSGSLILPAHPVPAVTAAVAAGTEGALEHSHGGTRTLTTLNRVEALGWTLVVSGPAADLLPEP